MPFVNGKLELLTTIELGQVPVMAPTFQLRERIGFYEGRDGAEPTEATVTWAPAHKPSLTPGPGERTDLASVPSIFWSLIASYGRQTAPAIVHDAECWRVRQAVASGAFTPREAIAERERIDRAFRLGLRELGVAPFRAWLMWTFVSLERYVKHSVWRFVLIALLAAVGLASAVFAPISLVLGMPPWVAVLALLAPLATSALATRQWVLLVWASYAGALMLPVVVFQLGAYLPFWLIENVVWAIIDLPKGKGSPVVGPTDLRNMRRAAS
jgi:hypothetical protein